MEKGYVVQWRTCWKLEVMREERKIWVRYEDLRYHVKNNTLLASDLPCSLVYRNATSWKHTYRGCLGSSLGIILMVKIPSCHSQLIFLKMGLRTTQKNFGAVSSTSSVTSGPYDGLHKELSFSDNVCILPYRRCLCWYLLTYRSYLNPIQLIYPFK